MNLYDNGTHIRTFPRADIAAVLTAEGFDIEYWGFRRMWLRMLIAPLLVICRPLKMRWLVLYDLWDMTGFCYVIRPRGGPPSRRFRLALRGGGFRRRPNGLQASRS